MSLFEVKNRHVCPECGSIFFEWQSQPRKYCSRQCKENNAPYTHGMTGTQEYRAWKAMKRRCYSPAQSQYEDYGGRGIVVCDEWINSFETFLSDLGRKPTPKHTLERINNDRGYSPQNCRWATYKEQANNRRPYPKNRKSVKI